ncbi:MAG: PorV/PorQ family protein [Gemmatimonadales bacterium]|jgi:hypothetical protein
MYRKIIALTVAALSVSASGLWAQNVGNGLQPEPNQSTTRVGTRGANWLEIPVGARAQALGGSGAALIRGAEAMYWNAGALAQSEGFDIAFSYTDMYAEADVSHQFFGVVVPLGEVGALGASVLALNSGDIVRTTESYPEGGDPQFGQTFDFTGFAGSLAYSRLITDRLGVGIAAKLVSEGIDDAQANWFGLDIGALFRTGLLGATLGGAIVNIGGDASYKGSAIERIVGGQTGTFPTKDNVPIAFNTRDISLPTAFRLSVLFDVTGTPEAWLSRVPANHKLRLSTDFYDSIDTALQPSVGIEYSYNDLVYARVGKRFRNEADDSSFREFSDGLGVGGGLWVPVFGKRLGFDYAYTDMGLLENVQTFSFRLGS